MGCTLEEEGAVSSKTPQDSGFPKGLDSRGEH